MNDTDVFQINAPEVISENIEGEVVIIDLANGNYFSTTLVGAEIWGLVQSGHSVAGIAEAVRNGYDVDGEDLQTEVRRFLGELRGEGLIVQAALPGCAEPPELRPSTGQGPGSRPPFVPPALSKYTDMKDMLLLDPIHDVEASGWPSPKDGDEPGASGPVKSPREDPS